MNKNKITSTNKIKPSGLIFAGGRASRMGGADKGLILFNGKPMVEHCITLLSPQVGQLSISANRNIEQYKQYGFVVFEDNFGNYAGPLAGLLRALENSKDAPVLVAPCDAPMLSSGLAERLIDSYEDGISAVIPHDGTRLQTLFGLYAPGTISSLSEYLTSGQRKVETWVTSLSHVIVDFSNEKEKFMNINTEDDLQRAQSIVKKTQEF